MPILMRISSSPRRPRGLPGQIRAAIGLATYLRKSRPDAVITYQHYGNIFGTIGARLAGVSRIIANQSGAPHTKGVMGVLSQIDRLMGVVGLYRTNVVNSAWTEAQFSHYPQAYRRRLRRIDHGVAAPPEDFDKAAARASLWLASECMARRLVRPADANRRTRSRSLGRSNSCPISMSRLPVSGRSATRLSPWPKSRDVADRLHLVGEVPPSRIFEFLAAGDIYAFPSLNETFGLACVEAAISGLPVVANDLAVMREVLATEDGETAAIFVEDDATGMAKGLADLMAGPEIMARLSAAGRRLKDKYAPARMCAGYEALLLS